MQELVTIAACNAISPYSAAMVLSDMATGPPISGFNMPPNAPPGGIHLGMIDGSDSITPTPTAVAWPTMSDGDMTPLTPPGPGVWTPATRSAAFRTRQRSGAWSGSQPTPSARSPDTKRPKGGRD